jgi:hypothetical protein
MRSFYSHSIFCLFFGCRAPLVHLSDVRCYAWRLQRWCCGVDHIIHKEHCEHPVNGTNLIFRTTTLLFPEPANLLVGPMQWVARLLQGVVNAFTIVNLSAATMMPLTSTMAIRTTAHSRMGSRIG